MRYLIAIIIFFSFANNALAQQNFTPAQPVTKNSKKTGGVKYFKTKYWGLKRPLLPPGMHHPGYAAYYKWILQLPPKKKVRIKAESILLFKAALKVAEEYAHSPWQKKVLALLKKNTYPAYSIYRGQSRYLKIHYKKPGSKSRVSIFFSMKKKAWFSGHEQSIQLPYRCHAKFFCGLSLLHEGSHFAYHKSRQKKHSFHHYATEEKQVVQKVDCPMVQRYFPRRYKILMRVKSPNIPHFRWLIMYHFPLETSEFLRMMGNAMLVCRAAKRSLASFKRTLKHLGAHKRYKK